jgi:hypothetical protein
VDVTDRNTPGLHVRLDLAQGLGQGNDSGVCHVDSWFSLILPYQVINSVHGLPQIKESKGNPRVQIFPAKRCKGFLSLGETIQGMDDTGET